MGPVAVVGPANVEAGECDRCAGEARLVLTCGPRVGLYLGRRCAVELGAEAWCAGHAAEAAAAADWVNRLPPEADTVARIWWVATGEVRIGEPVLAQQLGELALSHR